MTRAKRSVASRAKRKKILKQSKGYYGARSRSYRIALQSVTKSGQYAYRDRRRKKRNFRKLWIIRINAASRKYGIPYSTFINKIKKCSINLNRKMLSDIAISDKYAFAKLIDYIKSSNTLIN